MKRNLLYICDSPNSFARYRKMATDWLRTIGSDLASSFISSIGTWLKGHFPAKWTSSQTNEQHYSWRSLQENIQTRIDNYA